MRCAIFSVKRPINHSPTGLPGYPDGVCVTGITRVGGIRRIGRISRIAWVPIARLRVARIPVSRKSVGWVVEIATRWRWRCTHNSYEMPMM
jgi:hypothetical protein